MNFHIHMKDRESVTTNGRAAFYACKPDIFEKTYEKVE